MTDCLDDRWTGCLMTDRCVNGWMRMYTEMLKDLSSLCILISSSQRSIALLALLLFFLKIAYLHVSFTAYENF